MYKPGISAILDLLSGTALAMRLTANDPFVRVILKPCEGDPNGRFTDPPTSLRFDYTDVILWFKTTPAGVATGWVVLFSGGGGSAPSWSQVLTNGNTSGTNDAIIDAGQSLFIGGGGGIQITQVVAGSLSIGGNVIPIGSQTLGINATRWLQAFVNHLNVDYAEPVSGSTLSTETFVNDVAGGSTFNLPLAVVEGSLFFVNAQGPGITTVNPQPGDTINGLASLAITSGSASMLIADGANNWVAVSMGGGGGSPVTLQAAITNQAAVPTTQVTDTNIRIADNLAWNFGDAAGVSVVSIAGDGGATAVALTGGNTGAGVGQAINVTGGAATVAAQIGGAINITGGAGNVGGTGGTIGITAGQGGTTGIGGSVLVRGGPGGSVSGNGGSATVAGGLPTDGNGGAASVSGSTGVGTNRSGGAASVTGGNATGSGTGGAATMTAGSGGTTGTAGTATIAGGTGGSVSGAGGAVAIQGGAPVDGNGGSVTITGRDAATITAADRSGGNVTLVGGSPTGTGTNGRVLIQPTWAGDSQAIAIVGNGANSATAGLHAGTRNPNGLVSSNPGSIYMRNTGASGSAFINTSLADPGTVWSQIVTSGSGGGVTLQAAIDNQSTTPTTQAFDTTIGLTGGASWFWTNNAAQTLAAFSDQQLIGIQLRGRATGAGDGQAISILGGDATAVTLLGGAVTMTGGTGNTTGTGGAMTIAAGTGGATGAGGAASYRGGNGGATSGNAGAVTVAGGIPVDGNGGNAIVTGSSGVGTDRAGGTLTINGGNATGTGTGGNISSIAGQGGATGTAGTVTISGGTGGSTSGNGGAVTLRGGTAVEGNGGAATLQGRDGVTAAAASRNGGQVNVLAGAATVAGTAGNVVVTAGAGGTTGTAGTVTITAGAGGSVSGNGGLATLQGGVPTDGNGGGVSIIGRAGVGTNRTGGTATITAGNATGTAAGGDINKTPGTSVTGRFGMEFSLGAVALNSIVSPAALTTGNNNNYAPTNLHLANVLRLTPDTAGSTITGIEFVTGQNGRYLVLENISSTASIILTNEDTNSTAANRFLLPGNASITIAPNGSFQIWYDPTSGRWRSTTEQQSATSVAGLPGNIYENLVGYVDSADRNSYPGSGTVVTDIMGNATAGALTSATQDDGAFTWAGVTGALTFTKNTALDNLFAGGGTVIAFIRPIDAGETGDGRVADTTASGDAGWFIAMNSASAGKVRVRFQRNFNAGVADGGQWTTNDITDPWSGATVRPVQLGSWSSIAITYDDAAVGNDPIFYVNGVVVANTENITPVGTAITDVGNALVIANRSDDTRTFNGSISIVLFFDRILTASEVIGVYDDFGRRYGLGQTGMLPASGQGQDVTITGGQSTVAATDAGKILIAGGLNSAASAGGGNGGDVSIRGGDLTAVSNGRSGNMVVLSGSVTNTGSGATSSTAEFGAGTHNNGNAAGLCTIHGGDNSSQGTGGNLIARAGDCITATATNDNGGALGLRAGNARTGNAGSPGNTSIAGGGFLSGTTGTTGDITLSTQRTAFGPFAATGGTTTSTGAISILTTGPGATAGTTGNITIQCGDTAATSGINPGDIVIQAGAGTNTTQANATAGNVTITAGLNAGGTNSVGGSVSLTAGAATGTGAVAGTGGDINLTAGANAHNNAASRAGNITGTCGAATGTNGSGGNVSFTAGVSTGTGTAGTASMTAGAGAAAAQGGTASITAGAGGATSGLGGTLNLTAGAGGGSGSGGSATLSAGAAGATGAAGGTATVQGGAATDGNGGGVTITGRNGTGTNRNGGTVQASAGDATGSGTGGAMTLLAGSGGATGTAGNITLTGGAGGSSSGAGGSATLQGGVPVDGNGGAVSVLGRNGVGTNRNGGAVTETAGNATGSGTGGTVTITAGSGGATGTAGSVSITGGAGGSSSGTAGGVSISGGVPVDGNGGAITITASNGVGTNRAGGAVRTIAGNGVGSGVGGSAEITSGNGGATGNAGNVAITSGNGGATSGDSGNISALTGTVVSGTVGEFRYAQGSGGRTAASSYRFDRTQTFQTTNTTPFVVTIGTLTTNGRNLGFRFKIRGQDGTTANFVTATFEQSAARSGGTVALNTAELASVVSAPPGVATIVISVSGNDIICTVTAGSVTTINWSAYWDGQEGGA